jgi:hypothetical protein
MRAFFFPHPCACRRILEDPSLLRPRPHALRAHGIQVSGWSTLGFPKASRVWVRSSTTLLSLSVLVIAGSLDRRGCRSSCSKEDGLQLLKQRSKCHVNPRVELRWHSATAW